MPFPFDLKRRLLAGEVTIGGWLSFSDTRIAEMLATAGFDWIVVDMEHSGTDFGPMGALIQIIDRCGATPLVRVGANDPLLIKKAMDAGSAGAIVPMVTTVAEAEAAVEALYYPPLGRRGVGLYRAQSYGATFGDYHRASLTETVLIVQIEHHVAVRNLEAILAVPGVDGFIVGPYDMSGSLGIPGEFDHPDMIGLLDEVTRIANAQTKPGGFHIVQCDGAMLERRVREGFRFNAYGTDMILLLESLAREQDSLARARAAAKEAPR